MFLLEKAPIRHERKYYTVLERNISTSTNKTIPYVPCYDDETTAKYVQCFDKLRAPKDESFNSKNILRLISNLQNYWNENGKSLEELFFYICALDYREDGYRITEKDIRKIYKRSRKQAISNIDEKYDDYQPVKNVLKNYMKKFCEICWIYECLQHDQYNIQRILPNLMPLEIDLLPCGLNCFVNLDTLNLESYFEDKDLEKLSLKLKEFKKISRVDAVGESLLDNNNLVLLHSYFDLYKNNHCFISKLMKYEQKIECFEVYLLSLQYSKISSSNDVTVSVAESSNNNKKRRPSVHKMVQHKVMNERKGAAVGQKYIPCNHPGSCTKEICSCLQNEKFCEKYCVCGDVCENAFYGCNCTSSNCKTKNCACFNFNRECNPDRCTCKASAIEDISNSDEQNSDKCLNLALQLGIGKRLIIGQSSISGYGCFLNDSAKKDDFIGEYVGEIISNRETESRGIVCHVENLNYCFELNDCKFFT